MDRNVALDFVRVTEAAAIASSRWVGKGEKDKADAAAVGMMRKTLGKMDIEGKIVIGEGERDEAPMLYIGEKVGSGKGPSCDIAVDPLECTNSVAFGRENAMSVLAASPKGTMLHAPDTYMKKIACCKDAAGKISIDADVKYNLTNLSHALDKKMKDITVMVLDRERHTKLIKDIRECGARIRLISDGDVGAAIAPSFKDSGVDILMGTGGAPEGVLASAALASLGGYMEGKFEFRNETEKKRAEEMQVKHIDTVMRVEDMCGVDNAIFVATGVTDGPFLKGIRFTNEGAVSNSVVMRSKTKTIRMLETRHVFEDEPDY